LFDVAFQKMLNTKSKLLIILIASAAMGISACHAQNSSPASPAPTPPAGIPSGPLIWQIGQPDDLYNEFGDFHRGPEVVDIPSPGAMIASCDCSKISQGVRAADNPTFDIHYPLATVPTNGAFFSFKLIQAPIRGAQMAVFCNGTMIGLIQLWGTEGTNYPYQWRKTYRLYIPREMLKAGQNELCLAAPHPMWSDASADPQIWWKWDYLKLEALDAPITEPWHGKISYLGTNLTQSDSSFTVDDNTLNLAPIALKWLGIAYCGNTIRVCYWYDVQNVLTRKLEYLKVLAGLNMTAVVDYISGGHFRNDLDGQIPQKTKDSLKDFFQQYGSYFQFYELGNEPCMFGNSSAGGYAEYLTLAQYINEIKPSSVQLVAPGWAYGGGKGGLPLNWDACAQDRRDVQKECDLINGHSYGFSYSASRGGSFVENLISCGEIEDGWPKPYLNTETGTNNWHSEENGAGQASSQPKAQAFDRIMRAHIAVVDRSLQHAAIFGDYGFFQQPAPWNDLTQLKANLAPDGDGKDTRVKTYRRLALAYATHGAPLAYTVLNSADNLYKMVYFRAVDTSTLPPEPGSKAVSNKILLNFVNFENATETMNVRVTLPQSRTYPAERIGAGDTFAKAYSRLSLTSKPDLVLSETLGPGESVQYIVAP
jgi:hypothetical protein